MSNYEYEPLGVELELEIYTPELELEMDHPEGGWAPHDYPELMEDT